MFTLCSNLKKEDGKEDDIETNNYVRGIFEERPINLLSIDGGGCKGIITLILLRHLLKKIAEKLGRESVTIGDIFDGFAGTSIGSIIICSLLFKPNGNSSINIHNIFQIVDIFSSMGEDIFKKSTSRMLQTCWGITRPKYSKKKIEKNLRKLFGYLNKFGSCIPNDKVIIIPSYDTISQKSIFFENDIPEHAQCDIVDILLAGTAAPYYFASHKMIISEVKYNLIDGGVVDNDPAVLLYSNKKFRDTRNKYVLSIGTGEANVSYDTSEKGGWGALQWIEYIVSVFINGNTHANEYVLKQLAQNLYHRVSPLVDQSCSSIDKPAFINIYKDIAKIWIIRNRIIIDNIVNMLCRGKLHENIPNEIPFKINREPPKPLEIERISDPLPIRRPPPPAPPSLPPLPPPPPPPPALPSQPQPQPPEPKRKKGKRETFIRNQQNPIRGRGRGRGKGRGGMVLPPDHTSNMRIGAI